MTHAVEWEWRFTHEDEDDWRPWKARPDDDPAEVAEAAVERYDSRSAMELGDENEVLVRRPGEAPQAFTVRREYSADYYATPVQEAQ